MTQEEKNNTREPLNKASAGGWRIVLIVVAVILGVALGILSRVGLLTF